MAGGTKERIMETALELFAQSGYLGTSMNDIAKQLGITKAALYKHYNSKQEILNRIVEQMKRIMNERKNTKCRKQNLKALQKPIYIRRLKKFVCIVWHSFGIGQRKNFLPVFVKC